MVGGYQIIDFEGKDLNTTQKYPGMYHKVIDSEKPLLITNFTYRGVPERSTFADRIMVTGSAWVEIVLNPVVKTDCVDGMAIRIMSNDDVVLTTISYSNPTPNQ